LWYIIRMDEQNEHPLPGPFMEKMADLGKVGNLPENSGQLNIQLPPERMDPIAELGKVKQSDIEAPSEVEISEAEKTQLDTAKKVGRALADKLNNDLAVPMGSLDMLLEDSSLSAQHKALIEAAINGLTRAGQRSGELMKMHRFKEINTPGGQPMLDWDNSLPKNPPKPIIPSKP